MTAPALYSGLSDNLAVALKENPQEVYSWVEQGQLRLVASALWDLRVASGVAELRPRLERVMEEARELAGVRVSWDSWWKKVQPGMKASGCFSEGEKRNTYRLAPGIRPTDVPVEPVAAKPKTAGTAVPASRRTGRATSASGLADWIKWIWGVDASPLPGTTPPDGLAALLESWPEEIIEQAMQRLMAGVEEALQTPRLSPKAKDQWLDLMVNIHRRRQACQVEEVDRETARRMPQLLVQLQTAFQERDGIPSLLSEVGRLTNRDSRWRQDFASGLWNLYRSDVAEGEKLLRVLAGRLDEPQQETLWGDVLAAALAAPSYPNKTTDLDRILSWLRGEQGAAIRRAIRRAALDERSARQVAEFVINSRYAGKAANPGDRLGILVEAALLVQEGGDDLIAEAADSFSSAWEGRKSGEYTPLIAALLDNSRSRLEVQAQLLESKRERQAQKYQELLAKADGYKSALEHHLEVARNEIAANREESRLDLRRGMFEAIAATVESLQGSDANPDQLLRDVKAGLEIAMEAGGAEWYGKVGALVEFDPRLHTGVTQGVKGMPVTITSRGARFPGIQDFIIIKAQVKGQPEVS